MKLLSLFLLALLFVSCSSNVKKEIEMDKSEVADFHSKEQAINRAKDMILNSDKLNKDQKQKFMELHQSTLTKMLELNQEIYKSKMVLLKELVQEKEYDIKKVTILMNSVKDLYKQKANVSLDSILKAKKILGINYAQFVNESWLDYDRVH